MIVRIPAFGLLEIGLLISFAFLLVWDKLWRATLGPVLVRVGNVGFGGIHGVGAVHPLHFLVDFNENMERWTKSGLMASERGIVYAAMQLIESFALLFGVPLAIGLALYELAQYVVHHAHQAVTRVEHTTVVEKVKAGTKAAAAISRVQFNHLTHRVDALAARVTHLAHASAGAIATPFPRIGSLEKKIANQGARLKRVEKTLALGASAALVWTALRRLGLGWLRCSNVGKAGKAVCGMNPLALEALLLDAATLTVAFNLEEFARELQAVTGEAARLIHNFAD